MENLTIRGYKPEDVDRIEELMAELIFLGGDSEELTMIDIMSRTVCIIDLFKSTLSPEFIMSMTEDEE